jgi:hypothetical protein
MIIIKIIEIKKIDIKINKKKIIKNINMIKIKIKCKNRK